MNWLKRIFRSKPQATNNKKVSRQLSEFKIREAKIRQAGEVNGAYYTAYVEEVKKLKREGLHPEAIDLLLKLVDATDSEAKEAGGNWGVAPWYYEQLAIIYRKEKRFADEVAILKRYESQQKSPGAGPGKLGERLKKARMLAAHKKKGLKNE